MFVLSHFPQGGLILGLYNFHNIVLTLCFAGIYLAPEIPRTVIGLWVIGILTYTHTFYRARTTGRRTIKGSRGHWIMDDSGALWRCGAAYGC